MLDPDMRVIIRDFFKRKKVRLVDEVNLNRGKSRVDLLDTLSLTGFEIKSDGDSFKRLPKQIKVYNETLPYIYVCITNKYMDDPELNIIPDFYGIMLVDSQVTIVRKPKLNKGMKTRALIQILWKNELILILKELGIKHSPWQRKRILQSKFADIKPTTLIPLIIKYINLRTDWRN